MSYNVPILIICFKRYEKTLELFNRIKSISPKKLYVAIDGARNEEEKLKVDKVASIFQNPDCDFEIEVRRSEVNQGCKYGVFNAINWFFKHEEYGIILEDDILPYPQFFPYCEELLEKYKDDKKIACISGWSYFYNKKIENYDATYYFSHVQSSWGWATWKDRWEMIDLEMKNTKFEEIEKNFINDGLPDEIIEYYRWIYDNKICFDTTWDYQFCLSVLMKNNMYCIQPLKTFVRNVGDTDATHTSGVDLNKSEVIEENFVMKHPDGFFYNPSFDVIRNHNTHEYRITKKKKVKNPIKILFDNQIFDLQKFGGISRMYAGIKNELNKTDEFDVSISIEKTDNEYLKDSYPNGKGNNFAVSEERLNKGDFDIFYPTFFSPYFLLRIGNKPYVMSVHDMIPEIYDEYFSRNDLQIVGKREMVKHASAIEVPSECTKKDLVRILGVNEDKIHVIGRALNPGFGSKIYTSNVMGFDYILYVGQRNAYKRFDWFIKHIASFLENHKDIHIVCTGKEFNEHEIKLITENNLWGRVHAIFADDVTMASLYKYAKFFVFSSEYEGFGLPVLESYKMGCIALLNDIEVFREITDGQGTFFKLKENESNLSEVAEKIFSMSDQEKKAVLDAQYKILEKYSYERYIDNVKKLFTSVLNKSNDESLDIFICTHKDFESPLKNPCYKIINAKNINNDMAENGLKGSFYSEILTYKHLAEAGKLKEYVGFCHYRKLWAFLDDIPNVNQILSEFGCIIANPLTLVCSVKEQYATYHNIEDLYIVGGIIADKYPEYAPAWHEFINGRMLIPYNMFIMKREDFKEYIKFIFDILDEYINIVGLDFEKRIMNNKDVYLKDFSPNDTFEYQYRIGGYLAERLTNLFLLTHYTRLKAYPVVMTENKYESENYIVK